MLTVVNNANRMLLIIGGFVGEHEAGLRLFQAAHDPRCAKSGVYWSWNGGPREGRGAEALEKGGQISGGGGAGGGWDSIFENDQSSKVLNVDTQMKLFQYATEITGANWPELKQITSPCPTLKVIGAVTQGMVKREELKRMREMGRPGIDDRVERSTVVPKISRTTQAAAVTDKVVSGVLSRTVGRVARVLGRRLLGEVPEAAKTGSYHETLPKNVVSSGGISEDDLEATALIEQAIAEQLQKDNAAAAVDVVDTEDEALFLQLASEKKSDESTVST